MNKKGFTLTEVLVTVAIIAIIGGIVTPSVIFFMNSSKERKLNNIARSIFLVMQNSLADKKNNGTLKELADFDLNLSEPEIKSGYLSTNHPSAGKLDSSLVSEKDKTNKNEPFLYYMTLSKGDNPADDPELIKILTPYMDDQFVLQNSISVEFNALTGNVKAVYYSEEFDSLGYNIGDGKNDLLTHRTSNHRLGCYGVDDTGKPLNALPPLDVNIYDGKFLAADNYSYVGIKNALVIEAIVSSETDMYTIDILDSSGNPITSTTVDENGKPKKVSLSFISENITFDPSGAFMYTDEESDKHAGGIESAFGNQQHWVFQTRLDESHMKITWVLDYLDSGSANQFDFSHSIKLVYPDISMTGIRARICKTSESVTYVDSGLVHSYFASKYSNGTPSEDIYMIKNPRHLNNIRYTINNPDNQITHFKQMADIDFTGVTNFAPVSWIPTTNGIDKNIKFKGSYSALSASNYGYKISNLTMTDNSANSVLGLFGDVVDAEFKGVTIFGASISCLGGSRAGAIAGKAENAVFLQCVTYANVNISSGGTDAYAGGMVGELIDSTINVSYNGGYYHPSNLSDSMGSVNVSGAFSGEVCVGGLVGLSTNSTIKDCYNNGRVNISKVTYSETGDDAYKSTDPEMTVLSHTSDYKKLCIGGVVGKNTGAVENVYNTNFVGTYKSASGIKSLSGTVIGENSGTCINSCARMSNVSKTIGDGNVTGASIMTETDLMTAAVKLGNAFQDPTPESTAVSELYLPQNYRYPVLKYNTHITELENIDPGRIIRDLATVDAYRSKYFSQKYFAVRITSEDLFYEYMTDEMQVTFEWDTAKLSLDNSNRLLLGKSISMNGTKATVTLTINAGSDFTAAFYSEPYNAVPDSTYTVKITCFVAKPSDNPYQLNDYVLTETIDMSKTVDKP